MRQLSNSGRVVQKKKKRKRKCNYNLLYGPAMNHIYKVIIKIINSIILDYITVNILAPKGRGRGWECGSVEILRPNLFFSTTNR